MYKVESGCELHANNTRAIHTRINVINEVITQYSVHNVCQFCRTKIA